MCNRRRATNSVMCTAAKQKKRQLTWFEFFSCAKMSSYYGDYNKQSSFVSSNKRDDFFHIKTIDKHRERFEEIILIEHVSIEKRFRSDAEANNNFLTGRWAVNYFPLFENFPDTLMIRQEAEQKVQLCVETSWNFHEKLILFSSILPHVSTTV